MILDSTQEGNIFKLKDEEREEIMACFICDRRIKLQDLIKLFPED